MAPEDYARYFKGFSGVILYDQKTGDNMVYGYARVSTMMQLSNGNSIEDQVKLLEAAGCEKIITEAFTGKTTDRPRFKELIEELKENDTIVVCKLDRFARSAVEGVQTIQELFKRGIKVNILNMGVIENTLTGNLILTVLLAFAEYERGMIVERTQSGRAIARQKPGYIEGRPKKYKPEQMDHAISLLLQGYSYTQVERLTGISKSTLIRAKRHINH